MDLELTGRVVLVTGGSKGIGFACARRFAQEGAKVAIVSRRQAHLSAALQSLQEIGLEAWAIAADLTQAADAERVVAEAERALGPIDVLVNSAGAAKRYSPDDLTMAAWHDAMDAKYFTYVHAMQAVLPGMAARGRGSIVNIIGQGGKIARPTHLPGGAANAALMLVSAGMANAYGPRGIRVNAINPGTTETTRVKGGQAADAKLLGISEAEVRAAAEKAIPLGRYGQPEEVADVAVFLASARASYVTAACISMDGGATPTVV